MSCISHIEVFVISLIMVCVQSLEITLTYPIQKTSPRLNESEMVSVYVVTSMFQSRFAGLDNQRIKVQIPKKCEKLAICEEVPNYPEKLASRIALEIRESNMFIDSDASEPLFLSRQSDINNIQNACEATDKYIVPRLVRTDNGDWRFVLNPLENPIHVFSAEICAYNYEQTFEKQECTKGLTVEDFKPSCMQSYVYRNLQIIYDGQTVKESMKIPCCCLCAVYNDDNKIYENDV